jgi:hypothetical protein
MLMAIPPSRFPRTPPAEEAIQTNDWSSPEEYDWEFLGGKAGCFPISATMASFATSAIDAPRLLRRRQRLKVTIEMPDGERIAMASHETACKKAAITDVQTCYGVILSYITKEIKDHAYLYRLQNHILSSPCYQTFSLQAN